MNEMEGTILQNSTAGSICSVSPLVRLDTIWKIFSMGESRVEALRGISFDILPGEFISIMGPSGSGKSTCMNMIGCLDRPTSGYVLINGKETSGMTEKELAALRSRTVGFVFQQYYLLANMTVLENVMLPLRYQNISLPERRSRAQESLERMGLGDRLAHRPHELSGGQKQRTAIARATVTKPALILADEPTGALDSETGNSVLDLFREINTRDGTAIVIVTHDQDIGAAAPRRVHMRDGLIREDVHV